MTVKAAYFDCPSGISGDMILGALADAGLDFAGWRGYIDSLGVGAAVTKRKVRRAGQPGTKVSVRQPAKAPGRDYDAIVRIIGKSKIPARAKTDALAVFERLARAEAKAHGVEVARVHFHEVGAVDSIVDVVGAAVALSMMGIEKIFCSPLNLGSGFVTFSHGTFPVPAPATAELVRGFPVYSRGPAVELTTPTGAAVATALADSFGPMPLMTVEAVGYGAGGHDFEGYPNLLRVFIGDAGPDAHGGREPGGLYEEDVVFQVEANIDDMDPRLYGHAMDRLLAAGALDVWLTPIIMKKSRPAVTLSVLAASEDLSAVIDTVMRQTTTFGVRVRRLERRKLRREIHKVTTKHGPVRVKLGYIGDRLVKAVPEYEDVRAASEKTGTPVADIIKAAEAAARRPKGR